MVGVLMLCRRSNNAFEKDDVILLEQVACQIAIAVENTLEYEKATKDRDKEAKQRLYLEEEIRAEFGSIVGESPALKAALHLVSIVAPTDSSVLISGRDGHRQRTDCPRHSQSERPPGASLCQIELRSDPARASGK